MPQLNFSQLQLEPRHLQLLQSLLARVCTSSGSLGLWQPGQR